MTFSTFYIHQTSFKVREFLYRIWAKRDTFVTRTAMRAWSARDTQHETSNELRTLSQQNKTENL